MRRKNKTQLRFLLKDFIDGHNLSVITNKYLSMDIAIH